MAMVQFIETTSANLSTIEIKNGQILYVKDSGRSYFDSTEGKRVELNDLNILETQNDRTNIDNPINNKFYLVKEDSSLWIYTNEWNQINKFPENATINNDGLMSAVDKAKLDSINIAYGTCDDLNIDEEIKSSGLPPEYYGMLAIMNMAGAMFSDGTHIRNVKLLEGSTWDLIPNSIISVKFTGTPFYDELRQQIISQYNNIFMARPMLLSESLESNANGNSIIYLNVNDTGAKPIKINNTELLEIYSDLMSDPEGITKLVYISTGGVAGYTIDYLYDGEGYIFKSISYNVLKETDMLTYSMANLSKSLFANIPRFNLSNSEYNEDGTKTIIVKLTPNSNNSDYSKFEVKPNMVFNIRIDEPLYDGDYLKIITASGYDIYRGNKIKNQPYRINGIRGSIGSGNTILLRISTEDVMIYDVVSVNSYNGGAYASTGYGVYDNHKSAGTKYILFDNESLCITNGTIFTVKFNTDFYKDDFLDCGDNPVITTDWDYKKYGKYTKVVLNGLDKIKAGQHGTFIYVKNGFNSYKDDYFADLDTTQDNLNTDDVFKLIFIDETDASMVTGLATVATSGSYTDLIGIPTEATSDTTGLMSSTDKAKLDSIDDNATSYTHPDSHPASMITGLATVATSGSYNDLSDKIENASTTTAGLMSANDKSKLDTINIVYGTCATSASVTAKTVALQSGAKWELKTGSRIIVKCSFTNSANNPTLNVNNTGAKSIIYSNAKITTSNLNRATYAGRYIEFVYDGTNYIFIGWSADENDTYAAYSFGIGYGVCNSTEVSAAKVVAIENYNLHIGGIVSVKFTNAVNSNASMNINSKGGKPIYYRGGALSKSGVIKAGDTATFMYDGSVYNIIAVDRDDNTTYNNATTNTDGLMSSTDKTKLDGVAAGATKVVVDSELSATSTNAIQNKVVKNALDNHTHNYAGSSTTGGAATSADKLNTDAGDDTTPVYFKDGVPVPVTSVKVNVSGNATTATTADTLKDLTATVAELNYSSGVTSNIQQQLDDKLSSTLKGANNGLAELDTNGLVPSSQLPSYVDDVIEGYMSNDGKFYEEKSYTTNIKGESGKIYIDLNTEKTYRWSGSVFVVISETLALGETSSTAFRGDYGKTAYDHSQTLHARTDASKVEASDSNGNVKVDGLDITVYKHPEKHSVTMIDGLSNVATSGKYSDLTDTPTVATTNTDGLMSAKDKAKLDNIPASITIATDADIEALFN